MNILLILLYFSILVMGKSTGSLPFFVGYIINLFYLSPVGIIITIALALLAFTSYNKRKLQLNYFLRIFSVVLLWLAFVLFFLVIDVEGHNADTFRNRLCMSTIGIFFLYSLYYIYYYIRKWVLFIRTHQ